MKGCDAYAVTAGDAALVSACADRSARMPIVETRLGRVRWSAPRTAQWTGRRHSGSARGQATRRPETLTRDI